MLDFVHFNVHTDYSMLHSSLKLEELIKKTKELDFKALAITELANMFSAVDFYKKAKEFKPIIGIDAYIETEKFRLKLIAKTKQGYDNLMYLSSISYLYNYKNNEFAIIPYDELIKHKEGIVVIINYLESEIGFHLNLFNQDNFFNGAEGIQKAKEITKKYKNDFDEIYFEIRRDGLKEEEFIEDDILSLSKEFDIPLLATSDVWHLEETDFIYSDALECIGENKQFDDLHRTLPKKSYFKSKEQMNKLFEDLPESLENSVKLADSIDVKLNLGNPTPPKFKFTKEYAKKEGLEFETDEEYFSYKCKEGLEKRLKHIPKDKHQLYKDRLDYEIKIINQMKFPGYMLIVWDFVREANSRTPHIPVGPGRGSAAGSLVAYCLWITDIDPLKYGLLFERFLNPERVSMPDIDMDFCQDKRGEIIEYVRQKYGKENVAQVITFGSLLAKGVLRDVARIFGIDYSIADQFVKLIPDELGISLSEAKDKEEKIATLVNEEAIYKRLYDFGLKLEGLKRNTGMHAAGVVISDNKLWEKTPLYRQDENYVTQYSLNFLEDVDLIKFDFLGLKTLTVIDNALKMIKQNHNVEIDFSTMEMDDKRVFELISSGNTLGLFQIESDGMQDLNKRLKPDCFEDIIAVLALYRPGPMDAGMTEDFVKRKNGLEKVSYFFDDFTDILKPILQPTYGVIVYQEQVMQIVQSIGGFSLGEADIIRRAMGKKNIEYMKQKAGEFADGAVKKGLKREEAIELFNLIEKFAGYGFNKSHSAAYAMITYQTAYLKTYYPAEFFSALLSSEKDKTEKIVQYISELKRMGLEIFPPSVHQSGDDFTPIKGGILFGLGAIKGVGSKAIESIMANRPFSDLEDFIKKVDTQKVNKRVIEALIKSGGMDGLGYSRNVMLKNVEEILEYKKRIEDGEKRKANSLFSDFSDFVNESLNIPKLAEFDNKTLLNYEYEALGFYVSGHPLDSYKNEIEGIKLNYSSEIDELNNSEALFVGKVEHIKTRIAKKTGNKFGIVSFMDYHGNFDFMVFKDKLEEFENLDKEEPIAIVCYIEKSGDYTRINCKKVMSLKEAQSENVQVNKKVEIEDFYYQIEIDENYEKTLIDLYKKLKANKGNKRVILQLKTKFGFSLEIKTNILTKISL
jgi:DNA polymerase-3 subunit alpha